MPRASVKAWFKSGRFLPWLVLAVSLTITHYLWKNAQHETTRSLQTDFDFRVREAVGHIEQRLLAYEQVLRGTQGLFAASASVERNEFRSYVAKQHLETNYPGIQGVGVSLIVPPAEINRHIAAVRKESSQPQYTIRPEGTRDIYTSIIFLEPFIGRNLRAFGYDMYSEAVRRTAMEQARDTGKASISGKVTLVQETEKDVQAGFLMYLPIYRSGAPTGTVAERRANIVGWAYSPFRMNDLMRGIEGERSSELDVEIYDGDEISGHTLMYDADNSFNDHIKARFHTIVPLDIVGHRWTLLVHSYAPFEARLDTHKAEFIALTGIAASLLLALLTWSLARGRERAEQAARKMNLELIRSEERARQAISASHSALWDYDLVTGRVYLSEAWSELLGGAQQPTHTTIQELTGLVPEEEQDRVRAALVDAVKKQETSSYRVTHRARKLDGGYIWVLSEGRVTERAPDGRALRMIGTNRDITERKQAEIALSDSESRFRSIIEASPVPYALNDGQQNITYLNSSFTRTFGYTLSDIPTLAEWWLKAYPDPEYRQWVTTSWQHNLDKAQRENTRFEPLELNIRCKDGAMRTALVGTTSLGASLEGVHLVTLYDITERKQAEEMLRKLSIAVEQSPASVVITDLKARIQYINPRFTEVTGYSAAEAIGQNPRILQSGQTPREVYQELWNKLVSGQSWHGEIVNKRKNGELYWEETHIAPVKNPVGAVTHYVAIKIDITERKAAENKLIESEASLRAILDNVPYLIWLKDTDSRFIAVNQAFFKTTGRAGMDEVVGKTDFDLWPKELAKKYRDDDAEVISSRRQKLAEEMSLDNGKVEWVETFKAPILDKNGKLIGTTGFARDITQLKHAEQQLRKAMRYNRSLIEASLDPLVTISEDGKITDVNNATIEATGVAREQLIGSDFSDYFTEPDKAREGYRHVFLEGYVNDYPLSIRHRDGHITDVLYSASVYRNEAGEVAGVFAAARDITKLKNTEQQLHKAMLYNRSLIEASLDPLVTINKDGKITDVNRATIEVTGLAREQLIGSDFTDYFTEPEKAREGYRHVFSHGFVSDYPLSIRHRDGYTTDVLYSASVYRNEEGEVAGVVAAARDITKLKETAARIEHLAHFDALTDLPNRTLFNDRLQQALAKARRDKERCALMYLDLDNFKPVNDTFGHAVGDLLLQEAAERMRSCVRESDTVARIGGDEFVMLLPAIDAAEDALLVAEKIRQALQLPFLIAGHTLHVSSSIGIAVYPEHGDNETELSNNADRAMYSAKKTGRNKVKLHQPDMPGKSL